MYTEIHQVRGISGSSGKIELPCLVDQQNCGEVYYITWTRQSLSGFQNTSSITSSSLNLQQQQQQQHSPLSSSSQSSILLSNPNHHQQQWTRVYLYTGSNDSLPHKPIGDLVNRATFIMPERQQQQQQQTNSNDNNNNNDNDSNEDADGQIKSNQPMAKLVIEEPKVSDEALYKCDVTYVKGKCPSISLVKVQMLALPEKAQIISNNNNNHLHASSSSSSPLLPNGEIIPEGYLVGPYNEHEQLKLTCLVYGGRPQPKSVIWRKIDTSGRTTNLMPLKFSPSQQSTVSTSFHSAITHSNKQHQNVVQVDLNHTLTSADLGAKFECHVEHEAIEQPTARVVSPINNGISEQVAQIGSQNAQHLNNHQMLHDSMLDLHPSRSQLKSSSALLSDEISSEASISPPATVLLSQTNSRSKSLDSHVFVDLNGKLFDSQFGVNFVGLFIIM